MGGFRFRLYSMDGDDLGTRTFSEPNWRVGDTVALHDQVYRVYDVVYFDDDGDVRGCCGSRSGAARPSSGCCLHRRNLR